MPRNDIDGFFWDDRPPPKILKTKPKRNPPPRTWEEPDYLPNLQEALAYYPEQFTDDELWQASFAREILVFDIECYPNYFLIVFKSLTSGKLTYFESINGAQLNIAKLSWVMHSFCLVGFNSWEYDIPIASLAVANCSNADLWAATEAIIVYQARPQDVLKAHKVKRIKVNHIDLIEVAPLKASLKTYAGRIHCRRMQDLPFKPGLTLSPGQISITRWYCCNDVENTSLLYRDLEEHIKLRESLGEKYNVDLRSKSDAQLSETIIATEIGKLTGIRPRPPEFRPGITFQYQVPAFVSYRSSNLQWVLETVRNAWFITNDSGEVGMPDSLKDITIPIGLAHYKIGIGGLHSTEECVTHFADEHNILADRDVASFYPRIKLNLNLYPQHLGPNYIRVYRNLVQQRLEAKKNKDNVTASSLKIAVNGIFGKTGNPYSVVYSPNLLIQTTITGQLSLLMLIERVWDAGLLVVSANTDGMVIKCPRVRQNDLQAIMHQWEVETGFETEETRYLAILARDVNNYIAIKEDGDIKVKGAYSERGSAQDSRLSKNPTNLICNDAVIAFLTKGTPISNTIRDSRDITRFVTVRSVKGGAVKDGVYLGKSIRWYYATCVQGEIIYAINGNKVARTDNAKPCMLLPSEFPGDVDHDWYIAESYKILDEIGYNKALESRA